MKRSGTFAFMQSVRRSKPRQPSSPEQLLEAIVAAFRDKKPRRLIEKLLHCYPPVMHRVNNPFHALLEVIERYELAYGALPGAAVIPMKASRLPRRANAGRDSTIDLVRKIIAGIHTAESNETHAFITEEGFIAAQELKKLIEQKEQPCPKENQKQ